MFFLSSTILYSKLIVIFLKDVLLDDDTLLPQVNYTTDEEIPYLRPMEQAYILSLWCLFTCITCFVTEMLSIIFDVIILRRIYTNGTSIAIVVF